MKTSFLKFILIALASIIIGDINALLSVEGKAQPIDIVYTWVDGSDIEWQLLKARYAKQYGKSEAAGDANMIQRFRSRDELRYSLRSIFKYVPFVNHIYIVTCGQMPSWLRPHPKITVISHQEIFANKDDLPTYNSHAIEANLHRIPNLSERYIYMNDDVFFGSYVTPQDFFTDEGKVKVFLGTKVSPSGTVVEGELSYHSAWKNTNAILNRTFVKESRFHLLHAPDVFRKSYVNACERWFPKIFDTVSAHKFRLSSDYAITNGLLPYFLIYTNRGVPSTISNKTVWFGASFKRNIFELLDIVKNRYKTFCIEDSADKEEEYLNIVLAQFMSFYFPDAAPWEKCTPYTDNDFPDDCDDYTMKSMSRESFAGYLQSLIDAEDESVAIKSVVE